MAKRAYILGAGPVGLVAAWQLLENGWEIELFERLDTVGGMCRTWQWGDFLVDTGPHIFHTPDAKLADFWEREFGDIFVKGEFWCKNVKGDTFEEYYDYPLSWESISRYPKELKEGVLGELGSLSEEQKARAKSYGDYMRAQVGSTLYQMFFEKYPEKLWGIPTGKMTPEWAPKRVEFRQKVTPFYHNQWNAVGKYGTGCIYERIRDKILALGGTIHYNTTISHIEIDGQQIKSIDFVERDSLSVEADDVVISSLPITLTARFFGHQSQLQFRGIKSIYLAYDKPAVLPEGIHWLYYDSEKVLFNRITEGPKLSPHVAPQGKTFLTAEITFSKGDFVDEMDDAQMLELIAKQVELVGLADASEVIDADLNSEYFVYPIQYTGYQEELAQVQAVVAQFPQLYSLGTGGEFNYADSQILFHKVFDMVSVLADKGSSSIQTIREPPRSKANRVVEMESGKIGESERAYIIAEAGLNHNGSLELAKKLVDCAKEAGCDAVKFQTFRPESRVSRKVKAARYAETIIGTEETIYEMFDRLAMDFSEQKILFEYAREQGMDIFSTPFDHDSVDFLEELGVKAYKIASMDLVNIPLIKYVAQTGKPMILSTGMSTLGQIEEAVDAVLRTGNANVVLLHCISAYPAAPEEMNLRVMGMLRDAFQVPVGLSDHTIGLFVSHTALALGAQVIERHFTLDRTMEGPDHILSSDIDEFIQLVATAKKVHAVLGDGVKRIAPSEYDTLNKQRKSLYAACDIKSGETVREDMVVIKGPSGGLLPKFIDVVIGRPARRDIESDYPITWDDV